MLAKEEVKSCSCPKCRDNSCVFGQYALLLTLRDWPLILLVAGLTTLLGGILQLNSSAVLCFSAFSVVPLIFVPLKKSFCSRCGIEFEQ